MLKLSGNSEQTFAAHNSINMNPLIFAEWNYNNFFKPYNVYPQSYPTLESVDSVTTITGTGITVTGASKNYSYITQARTSSTGKRIVFKKSAKTANISISKSKSAGYYKVTFYVKGVVSPNSGTVSSITPTISPTSDTPQNGWTASSNYYFQVIPVGGNNYKPPFQYDLSDTATGGPYFYYAANSALNSAATLSWTEDPYAVAYDIYKSEIAGLPKYIATVGWDTLSYSFDTASLNKVFEAPSSMVAPPAISNDISISPTVDLYNGANKISGASYYVKFYDSDLANSQTEKSSFVLDGIKFNKVEVYFYSPSSFTSINLALVATSNINLETYRIDIDKFSFVEINSYLFDFDDFFPIESICYSARPGEALINSIIPQSYKTVTETSTTKKPISFGHYNPDGLDYLPYRKTLAPSLFSKFNYYISNLAYTNRKYISIRYDNLTSINKIILKFNNAISTITSREIKIFDKDSNQIGSTISITGNDEYVILYYKNGQWFEINNSSTNNYLPNKLTDSGLIQDCVDNVAGIEFSGISTLNAGLDTNVNKNRFHVVEISPRLELDISPLVKDLSIEKSIDSRENVNGFPIGYFNADSSTLTVSNIPVYLNGKPHTIFENISEQSTFKSLLKEGIKITGAFISPQQDFTETIPAFYMYVNTWSISGIDSISINAMDPTKYLLMAKEPPQYSSKNESIFDTMLNIFSAVGFSDLNYESLEKIFKRQSKKTSYYWPDISSNLYESLSKLFIVHQIGAWFDEYGIMQFTDLNDVINTYAKSSFKASFAVTDKTLDSIGTNSITYIPNLFGEGYTHEISAKPGKIIVNYRVPTTNTSTDYVDNSGFVSSTQSNAQNIARVSVNPAAVFSTKGNQVLTYSFLKEGLLKTDAGLTVNPSVMNGTKNPLIEYYGQCFIGGEAISWEGTEYEFVASGEEFDSLKSYKTYLRDMSDVDKVIYELQNSDSSVLSIDYRPTGNLYGVKRGKYGTLIEDHLYFNSMLEALNAGFKRYSDHGNATLITDSAIVNPYFSFEKNVAKITTVNGLAPAGGTVYADQNLGTWYNILSPSFTAKNCNYFSVVFQSIKTTSAPATKEIGISLILTNSNKTKKLPIFIGLEWGAGGNSISTAGLQRKTNTSYWDNPPYYLTDSSCLDIGSEDIADSSNIHKFAIYIEKINKNENANNDFSSKIHMILDGKYLGATYIWAKANQTNFADIDLYSIVENEKEFGVYVGASTVTKPGINDRKPINIYEIYAAEWDTSISSSDIQSLSEILQNEKQYHFQTNRYLSNIVNEVPNTNNFYFWESVWNLRGLQLIKGADFEYTPIDPRTAVVEDITYQPTGEIQDAAGTTVYNLGLNEVKVKDVAKSTLMASPFKFSLAMTNNSSFYPCKLVSYGEGEDAVKYPEPGQNIYLSTSDGKIGSSTITPLTIYAQRQELSSEFREERIFNMQNSSQSIQIDTPWLQSKTDVFNLMKNISVLNSTFNNDISVTIFGNPLIQVGDFCQIVYSLKELGYDQQAASVVPRYCFVKSVKHNYTSGFYTSLSLKPMFDIS